MKTKEFNADAFRNGAAAVTRDGHRAEFVRDMASAPGIPLGVIVHGDKQDCSAMYPESGKGVLDKDDLLLTDDGKPGKGEVTTGGKAKGTETVLTVGSRIRYRTWNDEFLEAEVKGIEICAHGEKEGRPVKRCRYRLHGNGVADLDNGHWCYFNQIEEVLS